MLPNHRAITVRCDSHVHVVGPSDIYPQIPERTYLASPAPIERLKELANKRSIDHFVIVQPSFYGDDNAVLLNALDALDGKGRGVAVINETETSEAQLSDFRRRGVRGLRFNLYSPLAGKSLGSLDKKFCSMVAIAQRLGWHVEVIAPVDVLVQNADLLRRSSAPVVIDHFGLYGQLRPDSAAGRIICNLLQEPHIWMKLSAPYRHDDWPKRYPA